MGKPVHQNICRKKALYVPKKWYEHKHLICTENKSFKILWYFNAQTDHIIEHRGPDVIIVDKTNRKVQILDLTVCADHRFEISQQTKTEKYQDVKRDLQKLWNVKVFIVLKVSYWCTWNHF